MKLLWGEGLKRAKSNAWKWSPKGVRRTEFKFTDKPAYNEFPIGGIMPGPLTSRFFKTGEWRDLRPVIDKSKCTKCALCSVYCPDGSVVVSAEGEYEVDLDHCKGCGICAEECPVKAITMIEEVEGV